MARSHARLKTSIHRDQDFLERTPEAKLTYLILLSDPRLTIAGVMELADRRWARTTGYDLDTLTAALTELEEHGYIVVDSNTDEMLIRTLAKHDLDPNRVNVNLAKGWWGAWGVVESPILRSEILHGMDEDLWLRLEEHGPEDGRQTRRSARLEPERHYPVPTGESEIVAPRSQLPVSSLLPPVTCRQPGDADARRALLEAAADIIGGRAAARPTTENPEAMRRAVAAGVCRDRYEEAYKAIAADPAITADELAELLEPTHVKTHPLDGQQAATLAIAERYSKVRNGTACPDCNESGMVLDDENVARQCACRKLREPA